MKFRRAMGPASLVFITIAVCSVITSAQSAAAKGNWQTSQPAASSETIAKPQGNIVAAPALNSLDDIAWMKGGTWVAEVKDKNGDVATRIETRIRGSENGHILKFTTTFVEHNRPHLQYEGVYLYDPQSKQIEFYYTDSEGNFTRGHAAFAGNTLTQDFDIIHTNGQADMLRSLVVRDGDNAYNWNVMSQKNGQWAEIFHLRYVREKNEN